MALHVPLVRGYSKEIAVAVGKLEKYCKSSELLLWDTEEPYWPITGFVLKASEMQKGGLRVDSTQDEAKSRFYPKEMLPWKLSSVHTLVTRRFRTRLTNLFCADLISSIYFSETEQDDTLSCPT